MNVFLWILQIALAAVFLGSGLTKLLQPKEKLQPMMGWTEDFSPGLIKLIGAAELLAALGLVLPWWTGIAPVLTPLAAVGLMAVMLGATVTHARRKEYPFAIGTVVLLVLAAIVAFGRF